ncbi:hypothetical protein C5167_004444 [Papaver somniferum]|uniref:Uncharacterized protein n=1 Tax=Papaver somniferum TaxID=3469 RepID=A0A4Y7JBM1_PAPSO|nr:hypothetical protein C5167_004444 [Papaver somniferum]
MEQMQSTSKGTTSQQNIGVPINYGGNKQVKVTERREPRLAELANALDQYFGVSEISVHPRHMKPHQIQGFNFLLRNTVDEGDAQSLCEAFAGHVSVLSTILYFQIQKLGFLTKVSTIFE